MARGRCCLTPLFSVSINFHDHLLFNMLFEHAHFSLHVIDIKGTIIFLTLLLTLISFVLTKNNRNLGGI
jgi:hypothetical protein